MNIKELKEKMNTVPDHRMRHDTPMNRALSKAKGTHHDISTGKTTKHRTLEGAKGVSVNPHWMPLKSERAEGAKKRLESHRASVMKNYPKGLTTTGTRITK